MGSENPSVDDLLLFVKFQNGLKLFLWFSYSTIVRPA